ncbi:MAG: hypothetical protein IH836_04115 [Proteobacteria bacterium]|nr:hypothetical protein [Pseudomonadota bacterium]
MDLDNLDGKYFEQLLEMQQYNPAASANARYAFTFDICGNTYARVLGEPGFKPLDLADLYDNPWWEDEAGFSRLWVSRTDWSELASEELRQLENDVTDDLRFDYSEDEVDFWFDNSLDKTYLFVSVYDVEEEMDDQD